MANRSQDWLTQDFSNSSGIYFLDVEKIMNELQQATRNLKKERIDVEETILFGSLARNDYRGASDADVAVILTTSPSSPEERIRELGRYFWPVSIPVDLLVYTRTEINKAFHDGNRFVKEIINYGKRI
ncbi:MAG: nucleotidyltransferase domain-containing protein [Firmicutes bacterium]|nr:nucleotidyltransferase domain-containing protein [Bacillota bacterium]